MKRKNATTDTRFDFLDSIPIDIEHTLTQLLSGLQSPRDGVPELVKNAKDQYVRRSVLNRDERQIVVILNSERRRLAVLDFAGAAIEDFREWQEWSSRKANRSNGMLDIEGGHGNGGKGFMVAGSNEDSFFESCFAAMRTRMGFKNDDPKFRHLPAFVRENGNPIKNIPELNPRKALERALNALDLRYIDLPQAARKAFEAQNAYSLIQVNGVASWQFRRSRKLQEALKWYSDELLNHPQAALTIESCCVWVLVDGKPHPDKCLEPAYPDPLPGFETPRTISVPASLYDPDTGETITFPTKDTQRLLILRTSRKHLRQSDNKALNVIRVRNKKNVVGNFSIPEMVPQTEAGFILGQVTIPELDASHLSGADRKAFADTPLVRATKQWVTDQVDELAAEIQKSLAKDHKPADRSRANDTLQRLRDLMRRYLEAEEFGDRHAGEQGSRGDGDEGIVSKSTERQLGRRLDQIVLEAENTALRVAAGTAVPLVIRGRQNDADGTTRPVPLQHLDLIGGTEVNAKLTAERTLVALTPGFSRIAVRDLDTGITSNTVDLEIVACSGADVLDIDRLLLKGERTKLKVYFHADVGQRNDLLIDATVDEPDLGTISRSGLFIAGRHEGDVTVRIRYGPKPGDHTALTLTIGPESVPPRARGGQDGGDIPLILLCGTPVPGLDDVPPQQRTHIGGQLHPTIIEEPMFGNVVWINPDSKEASRVRQGRGGTKGTAGIGTKTFTQFVALKCFDVLKRLMVRKDIGDRAVTELEFRDALAQAEMNCANFVDQAYELADDLSGRAGPGAEE